MHPTTPNQHSRGSADTSRLRRPDARSTYLVRQASLNRDYRYSTDPPTYHRHGNNQPLVQPNYDQSNSRHFQYGQVKARSIKGSKVDRKGTYQSNRYDSRTRQHANHLDPYSRTKERQKSAYKPERHNSSTYEQAKHSDGNSKLQGSQIHSGHTGQRNFHLDETHTPRRGGSREQMNLHLDPARDQHQSQRYGPQGESSRIREATPGEQRQSPSHRRQESPNQIPLVFSGGAKVPASQTHSHLSQYPAPQKIVSPQHMSPRIQEAPSRENHQKQSHRPQESSTQAPPVTYGGSKDSAPREHRQNQSYQPQESSTHTSAAFDAGGSKDATAARTNSHLPQSPAPQKIVVSDKHHQNETPGNHTYPPQHSTSSAPNQVYPKTYESSLTSSSFQQPKPSPSQPAASSSAEATTAPRRSASFYIHELKSPVLQKSDSLLEARKKLMKKMKKKNKEKEKGNVVVSVERDKRGRLGLVRKLEKT